MATKTTSQSVTRRNVIRSGAALGLLAPLGFGTALGAAAQENAGDYHGHPAVGVWIEGTEGVDRTFAYDVFHADGTFQYFNPWLGSAGGDGDPKLAAVGYGVWRPTSDRDVEATFRIAWIDTTATKHAILRTRGTVDESGATFWGEYKARMLDSRGNVLWEDSGSAMMDRMEIEPFDDPEPSEATPEE